MISGETREFAEAVKAQGGNVGAQPRQTVSKRLGRHDVPMYVAAPTYVKGDRAAGHNLGDPPGMGGGTKNKPAPQVSPIAARVREQLARLGKSESRVSQDLGWERTVLSTILRRLDERPEANIRSDTLRKLELAIGRPAQWILTGVEPPGVRLADCPGWEEAVKAAREWWQIPEDKIALAGEARLPQAVKRVDPALIRALADAL